MLRRIYRKIFPRKSQTLIQSLIDTGNLKIGKNCNLDKLTITIYGQENGFLNITIGDDCYLMGEITLHQSKSKIEIGDRVFIGPNSTIFCYDSVKIFNDVMFSWGCTIIDTNAHSLNSEERASDVIDWKKGWQFKNWSVVQSKKIIVEQKCWIGFNSIITKGTTLGEGTIVASGSVVTKSTKPYTIVGGNPAQFIADTK